MELIQGEAVKSSGQKDTGFMTHPFADTGGVSYSRGEWLFSKRRVHAGEVHEDIPENLGECGVQLDPQGLVEALIFLVRLRYRSNKMLKPVKQMERFIVIDRETKSVRVHGEEECLDAERHLSEAEYYLVPFNKIKLKRPGHWFRPGTQHPFIRLEDVLEFQRQILEYIAGQSLEKKEEVLASWLS